MVDNFQVCTIKVDTRIYYGDQGHTRKDELCSWSIKKSYVNLPCKNVVLMSNCIMSRSSIATMERIVMMESNLATCAYVY
jgi:hypothetical protein